MGLEGEGDRVLFQNISSQRTKTGKTRFFLVPIIEFCQLWQILELFVGLLILYATIVYSSMIKSKVKDTMSIELKEKDIVGGKRKRELIAVYIPKEKKVALEAWATSEERSVSWIVAKLIDQALCSRQQQEEGSDNDK